VKSLDWTSTVTSTTCSGCRRTTTDGYLPLPLPGGGVGLLLPGGGGLGLLWPGGVGFGFGFGFGAGGVGFGFGAGGVGFGFGAGGVGFGFGAGGGGGAGLAGGGVGFAAGGGVWLGEVGEPAGGGLAAGVGEDGEPDGAGVDCRPEPFRAPLVCWRAGTGPTAGLRCRVGEAATGRGLTVTCWADVTRCVVWWCTDEAAAGDATAAVVTAPTASAGPTAPALAPANPIARVPANCTALTKGNWSKADSGPMAHSTRGTATDRNARTTIGSNCVPAPLASSSRAAL
jgi:hypothetical protein